LEENAVFPIVIQPYSHVEQTAGKPRHTKTCDITYFDAVRMTILYLFSTPFLPFSPSKNTVKLTLPTLSINNNENRTSS